MLCEKVAGTCQAPNLKELEKMAAGRPSSGRELTTKDTKNTKNGIRNPISPSCSSCPSWLEIDQEEMGLDVVDPPDSHSGIVPPRPVG